MTNKEFLGIIKKESNPNDYNQYLKQLIYKKNSSDKKIAIFEVSNKYIATWIKSKFTHIIQNCFEIFDGTKPNIEIKIIGERKSKKEILIQMQKNENS